MQVKITGKLIDFFKKNKIHIFQSLILIIFWMYYTLHSHGMHYFHSDEAWYYVIAKDLNLIEIIKLMHYEGHTFLYYLLMKPFTHDLSLFPEVIKYFSWSFLCVAIVIFCFFSKINMFIKTLIVFSYPFLIAFPAEGKTFGLGFLFLFLLAILYKNRLKHPLIYAFVIFLAANTHVFITFGAIAFSFLFLYDLVKNKEKYSLIIFYSSIFIILFTYLSLIIQWVPVKIPKYALPIDKNGCFSSFFFPTNNKIIKNLLWTMYFPLTVAVLAFNLIAVKSKRWLFFIGFIYVSLTLFFKFIYPMFGIYGYFYYIYLIITYMLLAENNEDFRNKKYAIYSMSLYIILFSIILFPINKNYNNMMLSFREYKKNMSDLAQIIPEGSTVYLAYKQEFMPYLVSKYKVKSPLGYDIPSYRAYSGLYQDKILNPSEINTVKGEKSYYIHWPQKYDNKKDNSYKKYSLGFRSKFDVIDITKK